MFLLDDKNGVSKDVDALIIFFTLFARIAARMAPKFSEGHTQVILVPLLISPLAFSWIA